MIKKIRYGVKKISEAIALVSLELLIVFISFCIALSGVILIVREVFYRKEDEIDHMVFDFLRPYVSDINTDIVQLFTHFGGSKFLIPAWLLFLTYYFFVRKNKWYFIKLLTVSVSSFLVMQGLKFFFNRPRPLIPLLKEVPGLSFPSGHAFMSFVFYGMLIYIVYQEIKQAWLKWILIILLMTIIVMIGFTRIYLRVHYASDVLAGFCFGTLSLVILLWMLRQVEKFNAKELPPKLNVTKPPPDVEAAKTT
ncbi:MAG TPA: phosphatase PAP2 family protein [Ferruginibacter sp.]|nr:phosphatase PAP2 family protein [Ferruginibacter sp.]